VGVLKAYRGVHEVIATIMMNTILVNLTDWLAGGPWIQPGQAISKTPPIEETAEIGRVASLPLGFFLAVLTAFAVWFFLSRTIFGFELSTVGANRDAAHYAGMSVRGVTIAAMTLSGGLAGLGGAIETQGVVGRFEPGFNRGLGFDGITIALLAKVSPRAAIPAALLIGALRASSTQLQSIAQIAPEIVDVILAIALLLVAAPMIVRWALRLRQAGGVEDLSLTTGWGS
jgi:simple sugar transport system permease protein